MRIKQTTFYALRALHAIEQSGKRLITSKAISEKEHISAGVMIRILRILHQTGFLSVHQGRGGISGGFALKRSTEEITLLDVVDAMEGLDICGTLDAGTKRAEKEFYIHCQQVNSLIREELARHTLHELFSHENMK